ncbi:MAG TPA: hypothetical protein P5275_12510 [Saprospiraceae bacterium]|nr:hypothetical protein [Saprospiraceae bacterium]HPG08406.1 hypothetical protein [Saprospiraceae bacterium]HRV85682.1 hypothetical protein [Saprospiraceae bacterium]
MYLQFILLLLSILNPNWILKNGERLNCNVRSISIDTIPVIKEITNIDSLLAVHEISRANFKNLKDIHAWDLKDRIIDPLEKGIINLNDLHKILENTDYECVQEILSYFYQYNLPFIQNKRDLDVLSSHIDEFIDHEYDDFNYDFYIKLSQKYPGMDSYIENAILNDDFKSEDFGPEDLLQRYVLYNNHKKSLNLLNIALDRHSDQNPFSGYVDHFPDLFDYLYYFGEDNVKDETLILLLKYLKNSSLIEVLFHEELIQQFNIESLMDLLNSKLREIASTEDLVQKEKLIKDFQLNALNIYAKCYGKKALLYFKHLILHPGDTFMPDNIPTSINEFTDMYVLFALTYLANNAELTSADRTEILNVAKLIKITDDNMGLLDNKISLYQRLFPDNNLNQFLTEFSIPNNSKEDTLVTTYWPREKELIITYHKSLNLDALFSELKKSGIEYNPLTPLQEFEIWKSNSPGYFPYLLNDIFEKTGISISNVPEFGGWIPYLQVLQKYLNVCQDALHGYIPLYDHEEVAEDTIQYKLMLTNGSKAYAVNANRLGGSFDVESVESLVNFVLKQEGSIKRFSRLKTSTTSIYAEPDRIEHFLNKYGMEIIKNNN